MAISLYAVSIPVFKQLLGSLDTILGKAQAHAEAGKIDPDALLQARLFPDMFPLARQVQLACDFARSAPARLAGVDVPRHEDTERTFAELHALIADTLKFVNGFTPAQIDGNEERPVVLRPGTPNEKKMTCQSYLLAYNLPQFFFHVTTAYAILRHNGLEVGKRDYMGQF